MCSKDSKRAYIVADCIDFIDKSPCIEDYSHKDESQGVKWVIPDKSYRFQLGRQVFMPYLALLLIDAICHSTYDQTLGLLAAGYDSAASVVGLYPD